MTGCSRYPSADTNIAFMGDSITAHWSLPRSNFGVGGNVTDQMLARFSDEVLGHSYKAVVILGGTNDIHRGNGPISPIVSTAISNLGEMASMAEQDKLLVILCTIPPIPYEEDQVQTLNLAIIKLAHDHNYRLVDYFTPMAGHPEYFLDGIHPNTEGYLVMEKALAAVLPLNY